MDFLDFENKFGFEHNHESQTDILKKNIVELEKQLDITQKYILENINNIADYINNQTERLDRHNQYFNCQNKKIEELLKNQINQDKKIENLHKSISNLHSDIEKIQFSYNVNLDEIIQKQKNQEKKILELEQILELKETVDKLNKKRNFDSIKDNYIEQLNLTKKRSKPWSQRMSKYISITMVNGKWRWETTLFEENYKNFSSKDDAEKFYETLIAKYNIDPIHITRVGYNE